MIEKTIRVTIEKEFDIKLAPELLTQEFIDEFESYMFELDGDTLEEKQSGLFEYAAQQIAQYETTFVEGLGEVTRDIYNRPSPVVYKDVDFNMETEIV